VRIVEVNDDAPLCSAADFVDFVVERIASEDNDRGAIRGGDPFDELSPLFDEPSPWAVLNTQALAKLDKWVPQLFGSAAVYQPGTKAWRVSSKKLGRDFEEDLSISPKGIKDFGVHDIGDSRQGKRSPIDVVMEFRQVSNVEAFRWLDTRLRGDQPDQGDPDPDPGPSPGPGPSPSPGPSPGALSVEQWLDRDLPKPDFILGNWLTTTSRSMMYAPTGIGKTMIALAIAIHMALGRPFLHWSAARPSRVLFIDGEMARRVMKDRIAAEVKRLGGAIPEKMFVLSREGR
jgi:hypothetical protein